MMGEDILRRVKHSWNERDTVGYECPIKEFVNRTTTQVIEERGERIYQAVLDIGIHVDKGELLKALEYDRRQYEKGFRDGYRRARRWIPCSERLPEESINPLTQSWQDYRVTVYFHSGAIDIRTYSYGDGHWWHGTQIMDEYVKAWLPNPVPYREGDESND